MHMRSSSFKIYKKNGDRRQATKTIKSIAEISQFILKKLRLMLSVKKNKALLLPQAATDLHLPLAKITSTEGKRSHLNKTM